MFSFFRKKKKEEKEVTATQPAQSAPSQAEAPSAPKVSVNNTGALAQEYSKLLQKHKDGLTNLKSNAQAYTTKNEYNDKSEWIDALAICDVALDANQVDDDIKELYRQIYTTNWNKYVSMNYDDTDYDFWFHKNIEINERFIKAGVTRAYCEQSDMYGSARRNYRNNDLRIEYLMKGVDLNDATSIGDYGYNLYMGTPGYGEQDKVKGRELIEKSKELGYESANIQLIYLDFQENEGRKNPALLKRVEDLISTTQPAYRKPYHMLAEYYLRLVPEVDESLSEEEKQAQRQEIWKANGDKAVEAMRVGIEAKNRFCGYLLGMRILRGELEGADKHEGIRLMEEAYNYYAVYAASYLGSYYQYANDENSSIEKAIEWYEKASLYCWDQATYELACIYLYNEAHKDVQKGLEYMERAIQDGSSAALLEKGYLMLETDIVPRDIEGGKALLEQALEKDNIHAPYRLGLCYQNALFGGEPDYQKALEYFEIGAQKDEVYALEAAGNYYRVGVAGESPEAAQKAIEYLTRAVALGSNYARVELAFCYEVGIGVEQNDQKAFDLYKEAADGGYVYANTKLALYYEEGVLGDPDLAEAYKNYEIAANAGMPDAIYNKGRYHKYAVGMPENPSEAMRLFEESAQAGSPMGLVELALAYETEYAGTEFDAQKAMEYMLKAAEMGYAYAQYKVGSYYYYGLIETDIEKAFEWYTIAYEQNGYPYAALMLGDFYMYNIKGTPEPEYEKSYEYYKFAEERGIVSEGLGICYEFGFGVEENDTEAFKYHNLAANDGYAAAKYRLGLCYKYGTGTTVSLVDAYRWFSDAAENGNYNAIYETAIMLLNGEGVGQDEVQAAQMLTKLAEEDHDRAQFELGNCYLSGKGVAEDEVQAMYWYQKAADNGHEQAQKLTGKRERRRR